MRHLRLLALFAAIGAILVACASVLGFPDRVLDTEAGAAGDGAAPPTPDGGCVAVEDCTNGLDDDCNGLVDCADPACKAGFECVDTAPPGWNGPVELWEGAGDGGAPPCSPGFREPQDLHADVAFDPATCSPCTCATPTGVTCNGVWKHSAPITGCAIGCGEPDDTLLLNACTTVFTNNCPGGSTSSTITGVPTGGACAPDGGAPTRAPPRFTTAARTCAAQPGGGCGGGLCAARPAAPSSTKLCIVSTGDVACPPGAYTTKHIYHASVEDTRGCTACTCGAAESTSCGTGGSVTVYKTTADCMAATNAQSTRPIPQGCTSQSPSTDVVAVMTTAPPPTGGSCPPDGGAPTGDVKPATPTTVCCTP